MSGPIRAVVWSTGGVGAIAIDAGDRIWNLLASGFIRPTRSAGTPVSWPALSHWGLRSTDDADALIAGAAVPDYLRLLEAGINVVSTSSMSLVYPPSYFVPDRRDQLEAAAKSGGGSFYALGIFPGFASFPRPCGWSARSRTSSTRGRAC